MKLRAAITPALAARRMVGVLTIIVALCGVVMMSAKAEVPDNIDALRQRALELVNQARAAHGLSQLELGPDLDEAAQAHAQDMLWRGYFSHTSPKGGTVQDRYVAAGGSRWELVEGNIAKCDGCAPPVTAATVKWLQQGWMNSPEHRENILRRGLTRFGFGIAADAAKGLYAVQNFAGPGTPRGTGQDAAQGAAQGTAPGAAQAAALNPEEIAGRATELINEERRQAEVNNLRASPVLDEAARNLLPDPNAEAAPLNIGGNPFEALPAGERGKWRSLSIIAGACGGCGADPTAADIRFFRDRWLDNPQYKQRLLDPNATAMGFAMRASGSGRKTAVLVLGSDR
jgi:uncharacterized protein YkwD